MPIDTRKIYPLSEYSFVERESQPEEDNSVNTRLHRLEEQYSETGVRRSVEAIMLVTVHGFPHILVLQVANAFYKLPGGYLDPLESDSAGLITKLNEQLGVPFTTNLTQDSKFSEAKSITVHPFGGKEFRKNGDGNLWVSPPTGDWKVGDLLSTWWRPKYDNFLYPYIPAQNVYPKECKKLYHVELPPNKTFAVPVNMKLHAIPIYEFYDNASRYGPQFAGIPFILSRYDIFEHLTKGVEEQNGKE
ncbi:uncharacterized protein IL334_005592 [Kwoniella shivajii]|uniref:Cleavage and polyadenylation specificity factor subunit 5 n=1 Tax=Kwoniella shivajii TaxID=564305 RepID=A0ABZ1D5M4_9TREE|nr:hypothetical protein IL334_005592 [Kwoniella shivajii]